MKLTALSKILGCDHIFNKEAMRNNISLIQLKLYTTCDSSENASAERCMYLVFHDANDELASDVHIQLLGSS